MDIDIDFRPDFVPESVFPTVVRASMVTDGKLQRHPCGAYFQAIPVDDVTGLSAIPFRDAGKLGYFKIDLLKLGLLEDFESKEEVRRLAKTPPNWDLLLDESFVEQLFQLRNSFDIVSQLQPNSIETLADCVAIIRPNKRKYLTDYMQDPVATRPLLYRHDGDDKSSFKRSHAIAYASTIVLHMHKLSEKMDK